MRLLCTFWITFFFLAGSLKAQPSVDFNEMALTGQALVNPVDITSAGDNSGRLFIVEKRGTIRIILNSVVLPDTFLDIRTQVQNSGERGLLGLAFHPQYPDSPYVYINYVQVGTIISTISRFKKDPNNPNKLLKSSEIIYITQQGEETNHKAGDLAFGPDGYLYITMGDGGGSFGPNDHAQDINSLLGKILRIDVNFQSPGLKYGIPPTNPYVGVPGRDEVFFIGMRNPWRISFDRETGDMWIADVGQNAWEEVDFIPAGTPGGLNFGWDCHEGNHATAESSECPAGTQFTWPVYEYPHSCNPCPNGLGASITGGYVYRGPSSPTLQGYYICVDYISNYIWLLQPPTGNPPTSVGTWVNGTGQIDDIVAFGEAENGELYAAGLNGVIYRVTAGIPLPLQWGEIDALHISKGNRVEWTLFETFGVDHFEVQRSLTPTFDDYIIAANVNVVQDQINYRYDDIFVQVAGVYYRIAAKLINGSTEYSPIARILPDAVSKPALIYDAGLNLWRIRIPDEWVNGDVTLYDLQGKEVFSRKFASNKMIELGPPIVPGCYFIQINSNNDSWSDRFVW